MFRRFVCVLSVFLGCVFTAQAFSDDLISPEFTTIFQNPSYIVDRENLQNNALLPDTETIYVCDNSKDECRVNIKITEPDFTSLSSRLVCEIDFGFENIQGSKCNPSTVVIPEGVHEVKIKVYLKSTPEDFNETTYIFSNITEQIPEDFIEKPDEIVSDESKAKLQYRSEKTILQQGDEEVNNIQLLDTGFEYIFQRPSYIAGTGGAYECETDREECKINLKLIHAQSGKDILSKFVCVIDFPFETDQSTRCNPNTVILPLGEHSIKIRVYQKDNMLNFSEQTISITNTPPIIVNTPSSNTASKQSSSSITHYLYGGILIQSKDSQSRQANGDRVICTNVERCNLNLTSEIESNSATSDIQYFWDLGHGDTSLKQNPLGVWYPPGEYTIKLRITDKYGNRIEDEIFMGVYENSITQIFDAADYEGLKILAILANPKGVDNNEWVEIENTSTNIINFRGLTIDDIIGKGSASYTIQSDILIGPGESKRFYKSETGVTFGNTSDQANIYVGDIDIDSYSWDFPVPDNFIIGRDTLEQKRYNVQVSRVIDGDTIVVQFKHGDEKKVRLIGVDTPETKHPFKPLERFGLEAYEFTKQSLEGKKIWLDASGIPDKYGRLLGYIYVLGDDTSFNELLISKGYARAYLRYPFTHSQQFEKAQISAKKNQLGLWSDTTIKTQFLQLNREDKEILEIIKEEIIETPEAIYTIYDGSINEIIINDTYINEELLSIGEDIIIKKKNPNFSQSIIKQKKSLKIYGVTLPNIKIEIFFGETRYEIVSDNSGKYSLKLQDLTPGDFSVHSRIMLAEGEFYEVPRIKTVTLEQEYIQTMNQTNYSIYQNKIHKSRSSSTQKISFKKEISIIPKAQAGYVKDEMTSSINFRLLNILLCFMGLLMGYLVLKKWKII